MASAGLKWGGAAVGVLVLAVGGEMLYLHHRNVEDQKAPEKAEYHSDPDNLVFFKQEHPMSVKDEKALKGRPLWVAAGYQMVYYPYKAGHIDFTHAEGVLPPVEKVTAVDAVEAKAKPDRLNRIELGDEQVFLVFTKAGSAQEYATPVGFKQGGDYTFSTDTLFNYEDPHGKFSYWGPTVWKAIDEHRAEVGMSERQVYTALGQVATEQGGVVGDQTVLFDNNGHPVNVTFVNNKATKIQAVG